MKMKYLFLSILVMAVVLHSACSGNSARAASYEFTNIRRGMLERTVSASGTIKPVATVKVLPQMSGKVEKIYVDYNETVQIGDILAELNTDVLRLQRDQQYATVLKARANYDLQMVNYQSQLALAEKDLISEYEMRSSKTNLDNMAADLMVAEANLRKIETEISRYAYITSPINGIVLDRNINIGDTVVDSSVNNSSSIFTLAENLREMQIEATVGELDITSIHKGQAVRFSLESLPGRSFTGAVDTVQMIPATMNNVVTYTVIINIENLDGSLMPGMTCAVEFIVERGENILLVSNTALRYQPTSLSAEQIDEMVFNAGLIDLSEEQRQVAMEARAQTAANQNTNPAGITNLMLGGGRGGNPMLGGPPMMGGGGFPQGFGGGDMPSGQRSGSIETIVMRNLWYFNDDGKLGVMQVPTGINNGSFTEILLESLEGMQVILRERI